MTTRALFLLLLLLLGLPVAIHAQPAATGQSVVLIESAEVIGLPRDALTVDLQRDIDALAGMSLDRDRLAAIAARIDAEQPEFAAAVRDVAQPDGRVRVVFVVTRVSTSEAQADNVNTRYTVERVDIDGIDDDRVSQSLRDDLQALVGRPLEDEEADRLSDRLRAEFPDHDVRRRVSRGDESGQLRVTFIVRRSEASWWVPFAPNGSKLVYHRDLGWSGVFDIPFGTAANRFTFGLVAGNADDLVEEYSGYSFRFENREAGTRRLGVSFELSRYTQDWTTETLAALAARPGGPRPYESRTTVTPTATVAITKHLRVTGGLASSELGAWTASDLLDEAPALIVPEDVRVTATLVGVAFERRWHEEGRLRQGVAAGYDWESGSTALSSDLVYDRHAAIARYGVSGRNSSFGAVFRAGYITGDVPLYARFTLGDTRSLRGWNKYAIAPMGGDRMVHQSVEFRYKHFLYFVDAGSVWNAGEERKLRLSTGVGIDAKGAFITVGVPLNADSVTGKFMIGIRAHVVFDAGWLR